MFCKMAPIVALGSSLLVHGSCVRCRWRDRLLPLDKTYRLCFGSDDADAVQAALNALSDLGQADRELESQRVGSLCRERSAWGTASGVSAHRRQ